MDLNSKLFPLSLKRKKNPIWIVREIFQLLPIDIIRYICLWCLVLNEHKWKKAHKRTSKKYLNIFSDKRTICNNPIQMYLITCRLTKNLHIINLSRHTTESFWIEDDDVKEYRMNGKYVKTYNYIFHNKCRCYGCDMVRGAAVACGRKFKDFDKYYKMYDCLNYNFGRERWSHFALPENMIPF